MDQTWSTTTEPLLKAWFIRVHKSSVASMHLASATVQWSFANLTEASDLYLFQSLLLKRLLNQIKLLQDVLCVLVQIN